MSDIVIKNMKMPKICRNCPLCIVESTGLNFFCERQLGKRFSIELLDQRQEGCPLIELPPHGELVSRDEILNYFDDAYCLATKLDYEDAVAIVSNKRAIPTILEASKED